MGALCPQQRCRGLTVAQPRSSAWLLRPPFLASHDHEPVSTTAPGGDQSRAFSRLSFSPRPLRASPAGDLPGRLRALGQRPLRPPTRAPGSRRAAALAGDPPAGPGVSADVFPTRDPGPEPDAGPSAAARILRRWRDRLGRQPVRGAVLAFPRGLPASTLTFPPPRGVAPPLVSEESTGEPRTLLQSSSG